MNSTSSFLQIATTTANTVVYADFNVASGTTYYYQVRAFNSGGDSDYSNVASASVP